MRVIPNGEPYGTPGATEIQQIPLICEHQVMEKSWKLKNIWQQDLEAEAQKIWFTWHKQQLMDTICIRMGHLKQNELQSQICSHHCSLVQNALTQELYSHILVLSVNIRGFCQPPVVIIYSTTASQSPSSMLSIDILHFILKKPCIF